MVLYFLYFVDYGLHFTSGDKMRVCGVVLFFIFLTLCEGYVVNPGPKVVATKGEVWPKPQEQQKSDNYFILRPQVFNFEVTQHTCDTLTKALDRYYKILNIEIDRLKSQYRNIKPENLKKLWTREETFLGYLDSLKITLTGECNDELYPSIYSDEKYSITLDDGLAELKGATVWGIIRGLETFSQLVYVGSDVISLRINATTITDFPSYKHRGLLLDTSRHYIPMETMYTILDAMSYNKMNVFHWHIVDDQSFPYVSRKFPELSQAGAYNPHTHIYSQSDVKNIIGYARERGIRVLPEIDTPGHTRSWGLSHPELLTNCYNTNVNPPEKTDNYGPLDPSKNTTYSFLNSLFSEIIEVFADEYVHLGGDEVEFDCWQSNPDISDFMKNNNIPTYDKLEEYYIQNVIDMVDDLGAKSIVWQEVFTNNVSLPNDTIVQVWISPYDGVMLDVVNSGKKALLSACWYLDGLASGGDWLKFYLCEPGSFIDNSTLTDRVLGGEACMWAEVVNEYNVVSRIWPRASATAERLWSDKIAYDTDEAAKRLEEHTCRMNRRGVAAQPPNGAGFCE